MPHPKTLGRELALQYLYMQDLLEGKEVQTLGDFLGVQTPPPESAAAAFARQLVDSVLEHRPELDGELAACATNWKVERMAIVDRNVLRLGLAELISCPETPYKVVLNEAVELAKRFSSEEAAAFVNGILDKLRTRHRPTEGAAPPPQPTETPAT